MTVDTEKQEALRGFVQREVLCCVSSWVEDSLKAGILSYDDIENLYDESLDEYQEVYEWWLVEKFLFDDLREHLEPVIESDYGYLWGRTCTGQAIYLDSVIEDIYDKLGSK